MQRRLRIDIYLLFTMVFVYPFFYVVPLLNTYLGYSFSNYYFLPLIPVFYLLFLSEKRVKYKRDDLINISILIPVILLVVMGTSNFRYIKPLIFMIYFLLLYTLMTSRGEIEIKKGFFRIFFYVFVIISIIYMIYYAIFPISDRFAGFLKTSTVYSVFLEIFFLFFLFTFDGIGKRTKIYFLTGFLVYATKTRLNLVYYLLIPLVYFVKKYLNRYKLIFFIIFLLLLILLYPIYYAYEQIFTDTFSKIRDFEHGVDTSFKLRFLLSSIIFKKFIEYSPHDFMFGRGSEYARLVIQDTLRWDALPHNDFLRFFMDFGIFALVLYLILIYRLSRKNSLTFLLGLLYLFTFYHNMIYSFFVISTLIIANFLKLPEDDREDGVEFN